MNRAHRILGGCLVALATFVAAHGASAAAIGDGLPGPVVGFRLVEVGTDEPADGFQMRCCKMVAGLEFTSTTGAGNVAVADLLPIETDGSSFVVVGTSIDAIAVSPGTAIADVNQNVTAFPLNTLDTTNVFEIVGFYNVNTAISVDDLLRESVLATWTVRLTLGSQDVPTHSLGEFQESASCDLDSPTANSCSGFFGGATARFGPFSLEPNQTFNAIMETGMALHAVVSEEPASISEPSALAILAVYGIALAALGWRQRRRPSRRVMCA